MAQAFRSTKRAGSSDSAENALQIVGCYNLDHKVVVEWERFLDECELLELLGELPDDPLGFDDIRLVASSWCQTRDSSLATTRFTHFRVNRSSVSAIIAWAVERSLLVPDGSAPLSGRSAWIRQPILSSQFEDR